MRAFIEWFRLLWPTFQTCYSPSVPSTFVSKLLFHLSSKVIFQTIWGLMCMNYKHIMMFMFSTVHHWFCWTVPLLYCYEVVLNAYLAGPAASLVWFFPYKISFASYGVACWLEQVMLTYFCVCDLLCCHLVSSKILESIPHMLYMLLATHPLKLPLFF